VKPHTLQYLRLKFWRIHDRICLGTGRKALPEGVAPTPHAIRQVLVFAQRRKARIARTTGRYDRKQRRKFRTYMPWLKSFKVGDVVAACYDGKSSRKCRGVVVRKLNKGVLFVHFMAWAGDEEIVVKFKRGSGWGNWYYSLKMWTKEDEREHMQAERAASASEAVTMQLHAVLALS
jgi:hypothetical protein